MTASVIDTPDAPDASDCDPVAATTAELRAVARSRVFDVRAALRWGGFLALVTMGLWPILRLTIGGDDFLIPALQYGTGGADFFEALRLGWKGAAGGHFNYLGQVIGAIVGWVWVQTTLHYGVSFALIFALTRLSVYVLVILATARFVRVALDASGVRLSAWRVRSYVAIALIGTLQIHTAWSHDPTANFALSGFGSAALGMWVLAFALPRLAAPSARGALAVGAAGLVSIVYYELNAAVVVAMAPLAIVGLASERRWRSLTSWAWSAVALGIPTLGAIALRFATRPPADEAYSGTAVSTSNMASTFTDALISSLPGSAWSLTYRWVGHDFPIRVIPTALLVVISCAAIFLHRHAGPVPLSPVRSRSTLAGAVASVAIYWWVATAIQAATPKVQLESLGVGYVYNYYAVGATAVAALLVIGGVIVMPRLRPSLRDVATTMAAAFVIMQVFVTWNLQIRYNETTLPSRQVWAAYADDAPESERCEALASWETGPWQPYYRQGLINGLQWAHDEYRGEPYCSAMWDLTTDKPDIVGP